MTMIERLGLRQRTPAAPIVMKSMPETIARGIMPGLATPLAPIMPALISASSPMITEKTIATRD